MDTYPFALVLAVATAFVTVFLGFLPAKNIRSGFFAREAFKVAAAWVVIVAISPLSVMHYPFILAVFSLIAWWNLQRDATFTGKIWLNLASGLGISIGVLVILAVTPGSLPTKPFGPIDAPGSLSTQGWDWSQALCLASLYLGGAIIGLAYVSYVLCREAFTCPGIGGFIQKGTGLLFNLTLVRVVVLLIEIVTVPDAPGDIRGEDVRHFDFLFLPVGACVFLILPTLAYLSRRATRFSSRLQPTRLLVAIMLVDFVTEILARIELL